MLDASSASCSWEFSIQPLIQSSVLSAMRTARFEVGVAVVSVRSDNGIVISGFSATTASAYSWFVKVWTPVDVKIDTDFWLLPPAATLCRRRAPKTVMI